MSRRPIAAALLLLAFVGAKDCDWPATNGGGGVASSNPRSIACGAVSCNVVCCPTLAKCATSTSECLNPDSMGSPQGVSMTCDGPEDCPSGEVCCAGVGIAGSATTNCAFASSCANASSQEILCHAAGDCSSGVCGGAALSGEFGVALSACQ